MTIATPDPTRADAPTHVVADAPAHLRHASKVAALMHGRADLRGVYAYADLVDEALRWTA